MIFDEIVDEVGVTISLLLTLQCNYECDHCFFFSSPHSPKGYMSNEVLSDVKKQVDELAGIGVRTTINLIGGEPTLNLKEFERVLSTVSQWDVNLEMTTNGWWLEYKNESKCRQLFEIFEKHIDAYGLGGLTVRISNDKYHDPFRSIKNLEQRLKGLWDDLDSPLFDYEWYCDQCGTIVDDWANYCPECDEEGTIIQDFVGKVDVPKGDWIFVDSYSDGAIPTGRGEGIGSNDVGQLLPGKCAWLVLSYEPDGSLMDVCCRGSNCRFGTVKDNPMVLLALAHKYVQDERPSCYGCHLTAQDWAERNLEIQKHSFEKIYREWKRTFLKHN